MFGKRLTRALAFTVVASLMMTGVAFADQITGDADSDAVASPHPNGRNANQQAGTTVEYDLSALIKETGNANDDVFRFGQSDTVTVTIARSGDWLDSSAGSPASWIFSAYDTSQNGKIRITVPCAAANNAVKTMTATLSGTASNGRSISGLTLSYVITATTPAAASCTPSDTTPPVITPNISGTLGSNGWYTDNVTVTFSVSDAQSAISSKSAHCDATNQVTSDTSGVTFTCTATSAGGTDSVSVTIKRDATAPGVEYTSAAPAAIGGGPNVDGWYKSDVTATFTATDNLSGFGDPASLTTAGTSTTSGEGSAVTVGSPAFTDNAGNTVAANTATSVGFKIDQTAPVVSVTGVSNGATYTLGAVPAAGCSTVETLSGIKTATTLSSSGGPVGSVTATCSAATDNADNTGSPASVTYSVVYDWHGFFRPVDNGGVFNVVKAGSGIPMKFSLSGNQGLSIFAASNPVSYRAIPCDSSAVLDMLEQTVTAGNSSLSYDALADQYNYVWKTEKSWGGSCRQFSMTLNDGTTHTANFKFTK